MCVFATERLERSRAGTMSCEWERKKEEMDGLVFFKQEQKKRVDIYIQI